MGNEQACRLTGVLEAGFDGEWGVFELPKSEDFESIVHCYEKKYVSGENPN